MRDKDVVIRWTFKTMDDLRFVFPWLADSLKMDGRAAVSDVGSFAYDFHMTAFS